MPTVKFTSVEEFCEELKRDQGDLHRRVVRCSCLTQPSRMSTNIRTLTVVSSYAVQNSLGRIKDIVKLEYYCGDLWGDKETWEQKILDKADKAQNKVEFVCDALGLEIRAGMLE